MELKSKEINGLISSTKFKKTGGFLSLLASLAASLLPTLLGKGSSKSEINTAKDVFLSVALQKGKKGPTGSRSNDSKVWQLFGLPGNKVPMLGDIPYSTVCFKKL